MPLKGVESFQAKVPALSGKRFLILPFYSIIMITIGIVWMRFIFEISRNMKAVTDIWIISLIPLLGYLLLEFLGFLLASQMWFWRNFLKKRYGMNSFHRIIFVGLAGILLVFSLSINLYQPFFLDLFSGWLGSPLAFLMILLDSLSGIGAPIAYVLKIVIGIGFLLGGFAMALRSVTILGLDYLSTLYLYFPEESKVQKNEIYSALRNPFYAAFLMIGWGGAILTCTLYTFIMFIFYLIGFYIFLCFVEERELLQRFGDIFASYQKTTLMFFVKPSNLKVLLKFIFIKKKIIKE